MAVLVRLATNEQLKDLPDSLFIRYLVAKLGEQLFPVEFLVENVVVFEVAEAGRARQAPASVGELIPGAGLADVALGTRAPEDGPHLFGLAHVRAVLPGQRRLTVFLFP